MSSSSLGRLVAAVTLGTAVVATAPAARAVTIVLDGASGAVYDGVGDGWFFAGGPSVPPDGVGDLGGNAPAIVYQAGVVEMRALSEFPLSTLAGYDASEITSATLTVTIDDVLTTLGPGTTFDGTAASPFAAYSYPGDGTITPSDFSPAGLASLGIVTAGAITDASLASSGAVSFDIDVTASVRAFVTAAQTHYGVLLGTLDSPTGTSVDALSPPGVAGGRLPFLTIAITPDVPPVFTRDALKCQSGLVKTAASYAATAQKAFAKCLDTVLKTVAAGDPAGAATTACAKVLDGTDAASAIAKAKEKATAGIAKVCAALTPADVGGPCDAGAADVAAIAACIVASTQTDVEHMMRDRYAKGCVLLEAVGLDAAYPGLCAP